VSGIAAAAENEEAGSAVPTELARALTLRDSIALVLTVIGTGVFLKAAPMAQLVGSPSKVLYAWLAAGLLSLAGALTYAELGAMMPEAGGEYVFLREAYGDLPGFLFGWTSVMLIASGGLAAVSNAVASFLAAFVKLDGVWLSRDLHLLGQTVHWQLGGQQLVAVAIILLFAAINSRGLELGGKVKWVATVAKVAGIAIIVLGAFALSRTGSWTHLQKPVTAELVPTGLGAFGAAMIAALWAYQGWSNLPMVAGEIEKPERNIPRALIYGMLLVILVYLLANIAFFYALPFSEVLSANSTAFRTALPVASKAAQTFWSHGAQLVSLCFMIGAIGALNGITLMNARVPFAMARNGLFFRSLGVLSDKRVPARAIWFQGLWACVLALSGTFDQITTSVIFAVWLFTALVGSSLFVLRRKLPAAPRRYRALGYPVVPAVFVLVAAWLVLNSLWATPIESAAGLVLVAVGLPFFFFFRATRPVHHTDEYQVRFPK